MAVIGSAGRLIARGVLVSGSALWAPHAAAAVPAGAPIGFGELLGVGASLIMVIGAVVTAGWLYARSSRLRGAGSSVINILAAQPLGPKERIVLVEVGGKQLVVGMTAAQVQTLHVFDEPVVQAAEKTAPSGAFADRLRALMKGGPR